MALARARLRGAASALAGLVLLSGCTTAATEPRPAPPSSVSTALTQTPRSTPRPTTSPAGPSSGPGLTTPPAAKPSPQLPTYRVPDWWRPRTPGSSNSGSNTFSNFHSASGTIDGLVLTGPRLIGAGVSRSVLQMRPHTSTHASEVPKAFPQTNQLSLVRLRSTVTEFAGFTIRATAQGHLYNGLRVDRAQRIRVHDVRVVGIPGNASSPPGETFGLNDYRTDGARYGHVEIDGRGRGASGFGVNGSSNITIHDSYSHDNRYGMGFAFWQVRNISISRSIATFNGRAGFNFERVSGTVVLDRVVSRWNRHAITIASDQGSATYRIVDPVFSGPTFEVHLPKTYYGARNEQRRSDVHLIVHGHERSDLLRFT